MAENSKIEWTDHTFNPWIGCQKVSPGCDNCYAEAMMDKRYGKVEWGPHGERKRTAASNWRKPIKWNNQAPEFYRDNDRRQRVFCASLADIFDNQVPTEWRHDLWNLIRDTTKLDWLILTKRPENIKKMLPIDWYDGWPNVWLGTTCEDDDHYRSRYKYLSATPARIRFISYEPAIGPLRLDWVPSPRVVKPDWVICGGESGVGRRTMDPDWARMVRNTCAKDNIAFFMKQMTGKAPIPPDLLVRQFPKPLQRNAV